MKRGERSIKKSQWPYPEKNSQCLNQLPTA